MAKTQDLKRRIRSIRNTMQLTRAMKMVSAAKLRRAQERIMRSRPYVRRTRAILASVAARANPELNPLLQQREDRRVELVVLTGDKGLCGSFNAGILRRAEGHAHELVGRDLRFTAIGKRGRDHFRRRNIGLVGTWADVFRDVQFPLAAEIADGLIERYVGREVDAIYLVYNEFKSAIQAQPVVVRLLPIEITDLGSTDGGEDYIYEPEPQQLLAALLPHYVQQLVFQALLESVAAEHAARMTAMDSATKNAGELVDSLTLTMNRVRQASITTEIIEVVSGAQGQG
ncbi:MAG TPA: ATP synthase F1 subunit gamma [Candidatus Polarisedimenticolaceae bacterium]|nr:ATP synthase F1 subunit gamma [Candidatus Polarisedimenticolaceae bacterium]